MDLNSKPKYRYFKRDAICMICRRVLRKEKDPGVIWWPLRAGCDRVILCPKCVDSLGAVILTDPLSE